MNANRRRGSSATRRPGAAPSRSSRQRGVFQNAPYPMTRENVNINTDPLPIAHFNNVTWATSLNGSLFRSVNVGLTWEFVQTINHHAQAMLTTSDGEVLTTNGGSIYRSTGWSVNPATATFGIVRSAEANAFWLPHSLHGHGLKFVASEYAALGVHPGRRVSVTLDAGLNWTTSFVSGAGLTSHLHAACYDRFNDVFWFIEGHSVTNPATGIGGLYYSEDDGATWTHNVNALVHWNGAYIPIRATVNGLVCATDQKDDGIWHVPTSGSLLNAAPTLAWPWLGGVPFMGAKGFGVCANEDMATGKIYIGFTILNGIVTNGPVLVESDGTTAKLVYEFTDALTAGDRVNTAVVANGVVTGWLLASGVDQRFRMSLTA